MSLDEHWGSFKGRIMTVVTHAGERSELDDAWATTRGQGQTIYVLAQGRRMSDDGIQPDMTIVSGMVVCDYGHDKGVILDKPVWVWPGQQAFVRLTGEMVRMSDFDLHRTLDDAIAQVQRNHASYLSQIRQRMAAIDADVARLGEARRQLAAELTDVIDWEAGKL